MSYRIAVEDIEPNHYVAWVLDLPGCFASGQTLEAAIATVPTRIGEYYDWIQAHDKTLPVVGGPFAVEVVEEFEAFASAEEPDYIVNAFFEDDKRPLSYWEVAVIRRLLTWSRQALLSTVNQVTAAPPKSAETDEAVQGILDHIARAENWYWNHFNLGVEWSFLPDDSLERVAAVRKNTQVRLVELIGNSQILDSDGGERWSARKIVRRALWHERDHTQHIAQLMADS